MKPVRSLTSVRGLSSVRSLASVRTAVVAAALTGPLLLSTGCGIATTGVVESGRPGTVKLAAGPDPGLAYFLTPEGVLVPVVLNDGPVSPSPGYALTRLLAGPDATARAAGLTTELPSMDNKLYEKFGVTMADSGTTFEITLPFPVEPLSAAARRQLACTTVSALGVTPPPQVVLVDAQGKRKNAECESFEG